jgi:hypothetical protein
VLGSNIYRLKSVGKLTSIFLVAAIMVLLLSFYMYPVSSSADDTESTEQENAPTFESELFDRIIAGIRREHVEESYGVTITGNESAEEIRIEVLKHKLSELLAPDSPFSVGLLIFILLIPAFVLSLTLYFIIRCFYRVIVDSCSWIAGGFRENPINNSRKLRQLGFWSKPRSVVEASFAFLIVVFSSLIFGVAGFFVAWAFISLWKWVDQQRADSS